MRYKDESLLNDIAYLKAILSNVLLEQVGKKLLKVIEDLSASRVLPRLSLSETSEVIQAYSINFQLINLAEENFGMQDRRATQRKGEPVSGSIEECVREFRKNKVSPDKIQSLLNQLSITPVITAHPTEVKRRTVLEKHRKIYLAIFKKENPIWTDLEKEIIREEILGEVQKLWQTGDIRLESPKVEEEVLNGIFYFNKTFFEVLPMLYHELLYQLGRYYPEYEFSIPPVLLFGSWVGGDRDGNPFVTGEKTRWALMAHKELAISKYMEIISQLISILSMSRQLILPSKELLVSIKDHARDMGVEGQKIAARNPHEPYRQKLSLMRKKLENTLKAGARDQGSGVREIKDQKEYYKTAEEFIHDLNIIKTSLCENKGERIARLEILPLIRQAETFGFHLAKLDIRQHSETHRMAAAELLLKAGIVQSGYLALPEQDKVKVLSGELALCVMLTT